MRALIVDDQAGFRNKLRQMLEMAGIDVAAEAADIPAAERLAAAIRPDLAVVDVRLPGMNGIDGAPRLKTLVAGMKIYIISSFPDPAGQLEKLAREAGAEGFVSKENLDLELLRAWNRRSKSTAPQTENPLP